MEMTLDELGVDRLSKPKATPLLPSQPQLSAASVAVSDQTLSWRPQLRAVTPLLVIFDDGSQTQGETVRLRSQVTEIGRVRGDVIIPQDPDISSLHAAIECVGEFPSVRFRLRDLESTNGTFVRQASAALHHEMELILGSHRYRWLEKNSTGRSIATLMRIDDERKFDLQPGRAYDIGRSLSANNDGQNLCNSQIEIEADPFLSLHHATIQLRSIEGHRMAWDIFDHASANGVWCRVQDCWLDEPTEFMCGEQRFLFRYP